MVTWSSVRAAGLAGLGTDAGPSAAAAARRQSEESGRTLRFFGTLADLVAIALHEPALGALLEGRSALAPPVDRRYLLKILDEEAGRQFGHALRPVLELVLNAIDASRRGNREVDVRLGPGSVCVSDAGEGMSPRDVLAKLLVPFSTDKSPERDIGRFGVGFFAVLGLGLVDPRSFALEVETSDGCSGCRLLVTSTGGRAEGLVARLDVRELDAREDEQEPVRGALMARGTRVRLRSALLEPDAVRSYLRSALYFFPEERAKVTVDGSPLGGAHLVVGGRRFEPGPGRSGRFHIGGRALVTGVHSATFHAGVRVESCLAVPDLVLIDFPADTPLTEARDALKLSPRFVEVACEFYRAVAELAESEPSREGKDRLAELVAQVSALMLQSAGFSESASWLAPALLGEGRFVVGPERAEALLGFLGAHVANDLFVPESFWAERQWQAHLPGEKELLTRELDLRPPEPLALLARRRPDLEGLAVLAERAGAPGPMVSLATPRRGQAPLALPCLGTRAALLVREDAPAVRSPRGWADLYALRAAFDRASGSREAEVERALIVSDPARGGVA